MFQRLLRTSALYSLSAVLTRGLNLILLPIYTRILSQGEYGMYDYLVTVGALIAVTVSIEITQSVMRFVSASDTWGAKEGYIASGFWTIIAAYGLLLIVVALTGRALADVLLGDPELHILLVCASAQYFTASLVQFWTIVNNAQRRAVRSISIAVSSALLGGALSVVLLLQVSASITMIFVGQALGQALVVIPVAIASGRQLRHPQPAVAREMLRFSAPLVIASASLIGMTYLDRFLVLHLLGFESLGVYGLAARIAMGLSLVVLGFQAALSPLIYGAVHDPELPNKLASLFRRFTGLAALVVIATGLVATEVVRLVGGDAYADGGVILVILCAATLTQGAYIFFPGLSIAKKTWILAVVNLGGMALNAVLTPLGIEHFGLTGAASATYISTAVVLVATALAAHRFFPVPVVRPLGRHTVRSGDDVDGRSEGGTF